MNSAAGTASAWWQDRALLRRFVTDLLAGELARERRSSLAHPVPWAEDLRLDADLGVDSLERLGLAAALSEAIHLHESGIEDALLMQRELGAWIDVAEQGLAACDRKLTFRTSGSTGEPKRCEHHLSHLCEESAWHAGNLRGTRRILSAVPSHHIYGFLFNLLLARALGLAADDILDLRHRSPAWLAQHARPGDLVIGYPAFWQAVARAVPRMPAGVVGVTSTAPCPDDLAQSLAHAGLARLVQVYGASETAGIGIRESAGECFTLLPAWAFGPEGSSSLQRPGEGAVVPMPDQFEQVGARQFRLGPRCDGAVQVGGINVFPQRVASVLRQHPRVADASVRLMTPREGTRLKAFIVPRGDCTPQALEADLRDWIDRHLSVAERPLAFGFGAELPRTGEGKPADWPADGDAAKRQGP